MFFSFCFCCFVTNLALHKNSYNSAIFQVRSSKFCMVVGLYNTLVVYHTILYQIIPYYTKYHQTCNSNNSAIFQVRSSKFCMVVGLYNTHILYHTILYHTIPNYTLLYQIPSNLLVGRLWPFFKLGAPNFAW